LTGGERNLNDVGFTLFESKRLAVAEEAHWTRCASAAFLKFDAGNLGLIRPEIHYL